MPVTYCSHINSSLQSCSSSLTETIAYKHKFLESSLRRRPCCHWLKIRDSSVRLSYQDVAGNVFSLVRVVYKQEKFCNFMTNFISKKKFVNNFFSGMYFFFMMWKEFLLNIAFVKEPLNRQRLSLKCFHSHQNLHKFHPNCSPTV